MRFLVETRREAAGWTISIVDSATSTAVVAPHELSRAPRRNGRWFPRPSTHDIATCDPETHKLCADASGEAIARAFEQIHRVDVSAADVTQFGRYLTRLLLGESWSTLQDVAGAGAAIELEILTATWPRCRGR